jgi:hypothetical protein
MLLEITIIIAEDHEEEDEQYEVLFSPSMRFPSFDTGTATMTDTCFCKSFCIVIN